MSNIDLKDLRLIAARLLKEAVRADKVEAYALVEEANQIAQAAYEIEQYRELFATMGKFIQNQNNTEQ